MKHVDLVVLRRRIVLAVAAGTLALAGLASPAHAAVPRMPLTCGMLVQHDAVVYLTKNLTCKTQYGVRVDFDESSDYAVTPDVTIDLQGHTLRGPGTADSWGINAVDFPSPVNVHVTNGTLKRWAIGIAGSDFDVTSADHVRLVRNKVGYFCNGQCTLTNSSVKHSTVVGFNVGADASGTVRNTTFARNRQGASVGDIWPLSVTGSTFTKNGVGVHSNNANPKVMDSTFTKNGIGVQQVSAEGSDACATLSGNTFSRNRTDVEGPVC
jgi:hypothetical protein